MALSSSEAKLELVLLDSKTQDIDRLDVITCFTNAGLPPEIILRLEELWEATKVIGEKIIHSGRIIILEIMRFIEENPNLVIGAALGAAVGALVSAVPYLGPSLAPLSAAIGGAFGGIVGSRVDRGHKPKDGIVGISQELIILARKFFELLAAIFIAVKDDLAKNTKD